jgi:hypothetical protein
VRSPSHRKETGGDWSGFRGAAGEAVYEEVDEELEEFVGISQGELVGKGEADLFIRGSTAPVHGRTYRWSPTRRIPGPAQLTAAASDTATAPDCEMPGQPWVQTSCCAGVRGSDG